jgi:flagellar assembly factor FliW
VTEIDLPIDDAKVVTFTEPIAGFPQARQFVLSDLDPDGTFQLLQNLEDPELALVVCLPWMFFPEYAPEIDEDIQRALELTEPEDAIVFCSVTVEPDDEALYLNLLGPFVVNARTRRGRQVVQTDLSLPVRASVPLAS